ncbi:cyclophilin-like protein [Linderina pennispora]|uniref:Peptidyl-prolyl cis-trans isomerase n=1 Tax=Linderina pennispora TaxID=61395 RepID=A0A1Y1W1C5_9FUNG|nr:cyclophilin-like protein [Linderina pennispora]ORX67298.1 cyclophilin-like protein [Linderina pennispora]
MSVLLETSVGDIVIDLYFEETPRTCINFLKLCKIKYYNFTLFHRVERNFLAQAGDPTGTGEGGESVFGVLGKQKYFAAEVRPKLKHARRGTVSMAVSATESGVGVSGSQFFITLADGLDYLDGKYAVLNSAICGDDHRPLRDIRIRHTIVLHDPFPDPPGLAVPPQSPLPSTSQLASVRLGDDEEMEDYLAADPEQLAKERRERDAKAQALTLEMIGDLPFAEIKPPENILFVCKLNPATQDEDLETIFARFGKISSCESLGYAFVEFEEKEACEEAYFKMDNVLIDDRRIHVDFSQSVSKLHGSWVDSRVKRSGGLEMRKRYRDDREYERGKEYDMVFDERPERGEHRHRREHRSRRDNSRDRSDKDRDPGIKVFLQT